MLVSVRHMSPNDLKHPCRQYVIITFNVQHFIYYSNVKHSRIMKDVIVIHLRTAQNVSCGIENDMWFQRGQETISYFSINLSQHPCGYE